MNTVTILFDQLGNVRQERVIVHIEFFAKEIKFTVELAKFDSLVFLINFFLHAILGVTRPFRRYTGTAGHQNKALAATASAQQCFAQVHVGLAFGRSFQGRSRNAVTT